MSQSKQSTCASTKPLKREKLTDELIESSVYDGSLKKIRDGGNGLYIHIGSQAKYWRHDYRHQGKRGTVTLGTYPKVSIAKARNAVKRITDSLKLGINPKETLKEMRHMLPQGPQAGQPLDHETIISLAVPFDQNKSGVYFLIYEKEIVYVGMTRCFNSRIGRHSSTKKIQFDSYYFHECDQGVAPMAEGYYINLLMPKYNKSGGASMSRAFGGAFA